MKQQVMWHDSYYHVWMNFWGTDFAGMKVEAKKPIRRLLKTVQEEKTAGNKVIHIEIGRNV